MRALIVEDDASMRDFLDRGLREELFSVEAVADGAAAEELAKDGDFDAIVLDVVLPDSDGFAVCRRLRTRGVDTPILLLTGRHGSADRIRGLDAGADDYLGKPFVFGELVARLRALTRRGRTRHLNSVLAYGPLEFDQAARAVKVNGTAIVTSPTEARLVQYLLHRAEQLVTREELALHVWSDDIDHDSNVIDVYVGRLRKKLGAAGPLIHTVRRGGYMLKAEAAP